MNQIAADTSTYLDTPRQPEQRSFMSRHGGWILAIVLGATSWIYGAGNKSKELEAATRSIAELKQEVAALKIGDGEHWKTRTTVDFHTAQIAEIRAEQKEARKDLSEMKSDLRYLVEWVQDQRQRSRATNPEK